MLGTRVGIALTLFHPARFHPPDRLGCVACVYDMHVCTVRRSHTATTNGLGETYIPSYSEVISRRRERT